MKSPLHILSIDLGTSNVKVALVAENGEIPAFTQRPVATRTIPPRGAEQDPEEIWTAIVDASRQVVHESKRPADSIVGVTCASQFSSIIPIDESGAALGSMLPWIDERGGPHTQALYDAHPTAFFRWLEIAGIPPIPTGADTVSHILFIKNEDPGLYERAYRFVEPADFITTKLSGVCATNACTAFSMLLTDNRDLGAVDYHEELLGLAGIDREKLPDIVPVGSSLGTIRKDIAEKIGLSPTTRIFSAVNDTQAVAVGTGAFKRNRAGISVGTTWQILAFVDTMGVDAENFIVTMPSPIVGRRVVMAENGQGGRTLEHFLRKVAFANDELADHSAGDPFANVDEVLRSTPAGSGKLLYLPWLTGSQPPRFNPVMGGGFLNMSFETTRERMMRAVLEGITYSQRWLLPEVERFVDEHFDEIHYAGGGAVSSEWSQIIADVMNRPVHQLADPRYVNTKAAALLGFEELELASVDRVDEFCRIERSYEPRPENHETYERLFEQFVACYEQTRPIFEALNASS